MTTTTHVTTSCLITLVTIHSRMDSLEKLLIAAGVSFISHLILDCIPHGFIADPKTIFKKAMPTLLELAPGPIILISAIWVFGNPLLFLTAACFSILPDVATTLLYKKRNLMAQIPGILFIHRIHRKVHWFETDNPDGTVSYLFPNQPLLVVEAFVTLSLLIVLRIII